MKVIFEIPTEDFNAIQLHSAEELGIDFAQEIFDRIVVSEEIIDRDFSAIKEALCDARNAYTNKGRRM